MHNTAIKTHANTSSNRRTIWYALSLALLMTFSLTGNAQKLAVKNNLLYDLTQTPNIGFEYAVAKKRTVGLNFGINVSWHHASGGSGYFFPFAKGVSHGEHDKVQWRHILIAPEARYWFCQVFEGHFFGFNALASCFNMGDVKFPFGLYPSLKDHRRQGKAFGAGAFYGYSWILSPHWSIEAEAGIDVGFAHFKEYNCANCGAFLRKDTKPFVAPKIGINAVYNIK